MQVLDPSRLIRWAQWLTDPGSKPLVRQPLLALGNVGWEVRDGLLAKLERGLAHRNARVIDGEERSVVVLYYRADDGKTRHVFLRFEVVSVTEERRDAAPTQVEVLEENLP